MRGALPLGRPGKALRESWRPTAGLNFDVVSLLFIRPSLYRRPLAAPALKRGGSLKCGAFYLCMERRIPAFFLELWANGIKF